ncbi:hypothetical protein UFOVP404_9 [uncultured Caudovirales phage]|uniref:Uncharacterized protein n=1 Tax=uncultured Caudovirales phage TaxID=2100421 RepID=A0A6J5M4K6_9CAUD|nr:hypothetical protein UFOVP404_9 [uncultured Caudovirales phage]
MAGRDITEGRPTRAIAVDVGVVSTSAIWQNTDVAYDTAIGGMPFIYAISDARPYIRQTAPFRKEQFDNQTEPGEQSLTGWWIRSQQSFHGGDGITFYDPAQTSANSPDHYRFADSKGVNVWDQGKVTLLNNVDAGHNTTGKIKSNGRPDQQIRSIKWGTNSGVLLMDEYDVDKISSNGTVTHFIDYATGTDAPVFAITDDGTFAYWITNTSTKKTVYKKPLTGTSASTADVTLMFDEIGVIANATMEYVKERIVMCADNKVYEFAPSATAMPTAVYTHPSTTHVYTSIAASGAAIYVAGYNGIQSTIIKFTLSTAGVMPTLTSAITAAELPVGEIVHKIHYYLGYMMIGTNKGIRVAQVSDQDGSISYGPLIVETSQPCYDFTSRDHYVWCATGVAGEPGVIRIDLSLQLEPLRFAYANDLYFSGVTGHQTTGCAFAAETDQLMFCTTATTSTVGYVYYEDESELMPSGYLQTGYIRYNTLEPKNFKRLIARGDYTYGSMTLETVTADGTEYDVVSYDAIVPPVEVTTSNPQEAQEYLAYKFILYRDGTTASRGPVMEGYQAKSTIATPRQRVMKFPVYCYDVETDRYNVQVGYEGRAFDRISQLESVEENGDVVTWQDLTTGESRQAVIEQISFTRLTPPDRGFNGYGGIIDITIRTV